MKYTVVWKPAAVAELAEIWNNDMNRRRVQLAADEFDREAALQPIELGESRSDDF